VEWAPRLLNSGEQSKSALSQWQEWVESRR
jgi:hypothetical protein